MQTRVPVLRTSGILISLYLVLSVHSSHTTRSYSRHSLMETQLSSAMNQSHPKTSRGKNRHPLMGQQLTSFTTSMMNLTNYLDTEGKNSYYNHPSMATQFLPVKNSMMNLTHLKNKREKNSRIFSFSDTDNEISVELGFTIPFITIPIKGMMGDDSKPLVNVNVGAITAGTILTAAALIFIPKAFSGLEPEISFGKSSNGGPKKSGLLSRMDKALMDHNIDTSVCTQRVVCWIVKSAASKVNTGEGGSMEKIIDGIASNTLLLRLVQGTAFQEAIRNGRRDKDCSIIYSKCPITQEAIQRIALNFMTGIV